ncbi:aspartyl protease family protein [Polaribacter gangjinensis]|nr:aspartyl protease family protein [Polaribacter gangjinensis]
MIIEGEIDNKKGNFILDTGSETLILNKKYFNFYQFNFEKKGETFGVTGSLENPIEKTIGKMRLNNLDLNDLNSDVIDLSHIEKSKKIKLLGIIGFSILKDFEIFIDLYLNQITLTKIDKFGQKLIKEDYLEEIIDTVQFSLKKHTIVIEVTINNEKLLFGLDTGAELNQINSSINKKVLSSFRPKKRIKLIGTSSHEIEVIYGNLHKVKLNDKNYFGPMKTILTNLSNLNKAFGTDLDGILGHDFFAQKRVIINYKKQELYFIKYPIFR